MSEEGDPPRFANGSALWHPPANGLNGTAKAYAEKAVQDSKTFDSKAIDRGSEHPNGHALVPDGYFPDHSDLDQAKFRVLSRRDQMVGVRLKTYEKRRELGFQREIFFDVLAELGASLRNSAVTKIVRSGKLLPLIRELQQEKDRLQELEDEYVWLEDRLHEAEVEFEQEVQRFSDRLGFPWHGEPNGTLAVESGREANGSLYSGTPAQSHEDTGKVPPLLNAYYSRLEDANLIRERMIELLLEYFEGLSEGDDDDADHEVQNGQHAGAGPDATPPPFSSLWGQSLDELDAAERDLGALGQQAQQEGLLTSFQLSIASDVEGHHEVADSQPTPLQWEIRDDRPGSLLDSVPSIPLSTRQRVNDWFIKRMTASVWEVAFYRAVIDDNGGVEPETYVELLKTSVQEEQSDLETVFGSEAAFMSSNDRRSSVSRMGMSAGEKGEPRLRPSLPANSHFNGHHRAFSC